MRRLFLSIVVVTALSHDAQAGVWVPPPPQMNFEQTLRFYVTTFRQMLEEQLPAGYLGSYGLSSPVRR